MNKKFYQVCYTRVGTMEGWKSVNISEKIPTEMVTFFEKTESGNEVKRETPLDIDGNPLWMMEVVSNQKFIGLSRIQYGLNDFVGRSNFFCHGYLFSNAYDVLKNPRDLLEISDDNFKTSIEETEKIPETLKTENFLDIEKALQICKMTKKEYVQYIKCVYYALSTKTNNTIYVQTDGKDITARCLLYLTYCAIPYSLRTKITAATCTKLENPTQMLLFGTKIPEYRKYVNPQTGQNNILTATMEKRWERNPFVTYFAENYEKEEENKEIFDSMEKWLEQMGDIESNDFSSICLAYTMHDINLENAKDEEIAGVLYDWLALPISNSKRLEEFYCEFLNQIVNREIRLGKETEAMLQDRVKEAITEAFKDVYLKYLSYVLISKEKQEAYEYLDNLGKESSIFRKIRELLLKNEKGTEFLCGFYRNKIVNVLEREDCTQGDLIESYYDCDDIPEIIYEMRESLHDKNVELATQELHNTKILEDTLQHYKETEEAIKREYRIPKVLIKDYHQMIMDHFELDKLQEYERFYVQYVPYFPEFEPMEEFFEIVHALDDEKYAAVEEFIKIKSKEKESQLIIELLFEYVLKQKITKKCERMSFWEIFAKAKQVNMMEMMGKEHVKVLYDTEALENSLDTDLDYWTLEKLKENTADLKDYISDNKVDTLKDSYKVMKSELKQRESEQKRKRKKMKKAEKSELKQRIEERNEKEEQGISRFLNKLFKR